MLYYTKIRAAWFAEQGGHCVKCPSTEDLQCDHIDPSTKRGDPFRMPKAKRLRELLKCQVLCGDCHRTKSAEERSLKDWHGTITGYARHKCRCEKCRAFNAAAHRLVLERKKSRPTPFDEVPHGTLNGYRYHKCRCEDCTKVHAIDLSKRKEKAAKDGQVPHGVVIGYTFYGCRCQLCRDAMSSYKRKNRRVKREKAGLPPHPLARP